jgi:pimeloyl-ACP methyl ester carboxylesterase
MQVAHETGRAVVLVGHSLGGLTVSAVAEAIPDRLSAVVYLAAFMLAPTMSAMAMITHDSMASAIVPSLFKGNPSDLGAMRIDPSSKSEAYRSRLKAAFYEDVSDELFRFASDNLHCDEPFGVTLLPSPLSTAHFGRVTRHYIRCVDDHAIPLDGQDLMIRAIDESIGGKTHIHTLSCGHSPFYSQPSTLANLLSSIADSVTGDAVGGNLKAVGRLAPD